MTTEYVVLRPDETDQALPFDEGRFAYRNRMHHTTNPYSEPDWKHKEWWLGWSDAEECDGITFDWKIDQFIEINANIVKMK